MRGNRTATAALRSQTGFEDRPGHQAHAFLMLWQSLLHRLPVAAGEYSYVACATGDAAGVGVLEPSLGVLAARAEAVAESGQGDLTALSADGLYAIQYRLGGLARGEERASQLHGVFALDEQPHRRRGLRRRRLWTGGPQVLEYLLGLALEFLGYSPARQADAGICDPDLFDLREQGVCERGRKACRCAGLGDGELGVLGMLGGLAFERCEELLSRRCDIAGRGV